MEVFEQRTSVIKMFNELDFSFPIPMDVANVWGLMQEVLFWLFFDMPYKVGEYERSFMESHLKDQEDYFFRTLTTMIAAKGITKAKLAEMIGLSESSVSSLLARRYCPQQNTVRIIAEALGCQKEELWPLENPLQVSQQLRQQLREGIRYFSLENDWQQNRVTYFYQNLRDIMAHKNLNLDDLMERLTKKLSQCSWQAEDIHSSESHLPHFREIMAIADALEIEVKELWLMSDD